MIADRPVSYMGLRNAKHKVTRKQRSVTYRNPWAVFRVARVSLLVWLVEDRWSDQNSWPPNDHG